MRRWEVVTFDCYGTLIDWERGIADAFRAALSADGVSLDLERVLAVYHELEPVVQAETLSQLPGRPDRDRAARGGAPGLATAGGAGELPGRQPAELDALRRHQRRARTPRRAGYRLGILSNVDDDLLAGSRRHFTATFDPTLIITAQQVRSYKPAPAHFDAARARLGGQRWLHAAQSYFHDVVPARSLGIPVAWINRKGETAPAPSGAEAEFRTLAEFAAWMTDPREPLSQTLPPVGNRGAPRVPRGATSAGGMGGPFEAPHLTRPAGSDEARRRRRDGEPCPATRGSAGARASRRRQSRTDGHRGRG